MWSFTYVQSLELSFFFILPCNILPRHTLIYKDSKKCDFWKIDLFSVFGHFKTRVPLKQTFFQSCISWAVIYRLFSIITKYMCWKVIFSSPFPDYDVGAWLQSKEIINGSSTFTQNRGIFKTTEPEIWNKSTSLSTKKSLFWLDRGGGGA